MEKDTDSRMGCTRGRGCCIHSLFFYRIGGILRDRGTEVGCLGIRVDGLRSGCLALVGIWGYVNLFFSIILVNMNPSDLASHVDDGADGDDEKSNNELRSAGARVRTRRTRRARSLARRVRRTKKTTRRKQ